MFVVFLGPDGVGKSTVIEHLEKTLKLQEKKVIKFHLCAPIFSTHKRKGAPNNNPHGELPRSLLSSILKLLYFLIRYNLAYFFTITKLLNNNYIVLMDRYYHDMLIDPRRYRYSGPKWLVNFISKFVPSPDYFIVLDAPAEVLQMRANEVTFDESARQRNEYHNFIRQRTNGRVISTIDDINNSVEKIIKQIELH